MLPDVGVELVPLLYEFVQALGLAVSLLVGAWFAFFLIRRATRYAIEITDPDGGEARRYYRNNKDTDPPVF